MKKTEFYYSEFTGHKCKPVVQLILFFLLLTILSNTTYGSEWSLSMAVVAKVNGEPITKYDIEKLAGRIAQSFVSVHGEEKLDMKKRKPLPGMPYRL